MVKKLVVFMSLALGFSAVMFFATTSQSAASGKDVHVKNCQRCHGPQGKGDGPAAKLLKTKPTDWTNKQKMSSLSDDYIYKIIWGGGGLVGKSTLMPAFKNKLTDAQIREVRVFIRSL